MRIQEFEEATQVDLEALQGARDYSLNHLVEHLIAAARFKQVERLALGNRAWMQAKLERFKNHAGFIQDVERYLATLKRISSQEAIASQVQCYAALQCTAHHEGTYSERDLEVLVQLRREAEAVAHAQLRVNLPQRVNGLLTIDRCLRREGRADPALLKQAKALATELRPEDSGYLISGVEACRLASGFCDAGQVQEANELVEDGLRAWKHIHEAYNQEEVDALRFPLGVALAKLGRLDEAPGIMDKTYPLQESYPLLAACIEAGYDQFANTLLDRVLAAPQVTSIETPVSLVRQIAQAGWPEKAQEVAVRITQGSRRAQALCAAAAGYLKQAKLAEAQAALAEAKKLLRSEAGPTISIHGNFPTAEAGIALIEILRKMGWQGEAFAMQAEVEQYIREAYAMATSRPQMATTGREPPESYWQTQAINAGLEAMKTRLEMLVALGKPEEAGEQFDSLMEASRQTTETMPEAQDKLRLGCCRVLAKNGHFEGAIRLIEKMADSHSRAKGFQAVACAQAEAGFYQKALTTLKSYEANNQFTIEAPVRAGVLACAGRYAEALECISQSSEKVTQDDALLELMDILLERGAFAEALSIVEKLKWKSKSQALYTCAAALLDARRYKQALALLERFPPTGILQSGEWYEAWALAKAYRMLQAHSDPRAQKLHARIQALTQGIQTSARGHLSLSGHGDGGSITRNTAEALAALGQYDEAIHWMRLVPASSHWRTYAVETLERLTSLAAQAGDFGRALEFLGQVEGDDARQRLKQVVAEAMIKDNQFEAGLSLLRECTLQDFLYVFVDQWKVFDRLEAGTGLALLCQALRILGWVSDPWYEIYQVFTTSNKTNQEAGND